MIAWNEAKATFIAAKEAEIEYDRSAWNPAYKVWDGGAGPDIPEDIDVEMDRLQDIRHDAEAVLLKMEAPDATAFALKMLICRAEGRDYNGMDDELMAEALRFAPDFPLAGERE